MTYIKHFAEINRSDLPLAGGKGLNLGLLVQAGFSVPNGFCITTEAYRQVTEDMEKNWPRLAGWLRRDAISQTDIPQALKDEILEAYNSIGAGRVAVRSSATAEDLPDASFAGQQDTFLNVQGENQLFDAVKRCWASLWSERAIAYRRDQNISDVHIAMSVVVQNMIDSDVSGVMFTVNPTGSDDIVIESSWGLGEAIVSGKVSPDHFVVARDSMNVVEKTISRKRQMITQSGEVEIPKEQQEQPSLDDEQVRELAQLGLELERFYDAPQDIEWAYANEQFYLLQSRPITAFQDVAEMERLRQEEIAALREKAEPEGTVWSRFNLSEVLPAPLPMTWEIIKKFMSGRGGFGLNYRDLGFIPSPDVDEHGVLDLICGRVYFNLSNEAQLYFNEYPLEHNFAELKEYPQKAIYPQATVNIKRGTGKFWLKFSYYVYKMIASDRRIKRIRKNHDTMLTEEIFPAFRNYVMEQGQIDLTQLSDQEILDKLNEWIHQTLTVFAKDALKASVFAGLSYTNLEAAIVKCLGEEHRELAKSLIVGLEGDLTVDMNCKLWRVAQGELSVEDFLKEYGHRTVGEFELAQPRWREDTSFIHKMIEIFRTSESADPVERLETQKNERQRAEGELADLLSSSKSSYMRKNIEQELEYTQRYMPFRETAKFYIMLGYELIRKGLLEISRRYELDDDIFHLTPDELPSLVEGRQLSDRIAQRKKRRQQLLKIPLPEVIFSDALDEIGNPPSVDSADEMRGLSVSVGVAEGIARVLLTPTDVTSDEINYVLVCPSTDPGWTLLFLNACALVMERGGMLSHGAVVAREYGIPAVVNISNATKVIRDRQKIRVDGNRGGVTILP